MPNKFLSPSPHPIPPSRGLPLPPRLLRCAFLSITLSCVGARSPSLGAVGAVDPPWLLMLSRFLLLWIQAAARWQRLLGLHCCGGGGTDVGVWGRPSTEGVPWGGVVVPVYAGAWGPGGWDAALPSPACCWVASWEGVRCNVWGQSGALGWGGDPCAALGERPGAMPPTQQGAAPQQGVPCAVNKAGIQPVLCAPRPAPHPTPAPWALRTQPHCVPLSPPNPPCSPHTLFPTFLSPLSPLGTSFKCPMCPLHPPSLLKMQ